MGVYVPPSVRVIREDIGASSVIAGGEVVPALIGSTNGALAAKLAVAQLRADSPTLTDNLPDSIIDSVLGARTLAVGGIDYKADVDFQFQAPNVLNWLSSVIDPPYLFPPVVGTSGGTFLAGTKYYVVTAHRITNVAASASSALVSSVAGNWYLSPGQILAVKVDGGAALNAVFNATAGAVVTGNPEGVSGYDLANGLNLTLQVNGGPVQTITFLTADFVSITAATAIEVAAAINKYVSGAQAFVTGVGATAVVNLRSDRKGSSSSVLITGGTANSGGLNRLNFPLVVATGTGNVSNIESVTPAEAKSIIELAVAGVTVTLNLNGTISLVRTTPGSLFSVQVDVLTTTALAFSFPTTLAVGTDTGAPAVGQTVKSNEITAVIPANGKVTLTWAPVTGASSYSIYRSTSSGTYGVSTLLAVVSGESTSSYIDTGTATGTGQPPVSNTAYKRPAFNSTYYVDYRVLTLTYFTSKLYTKITDVVLDHGLGSDLAVASVLIMGRSGRGNEASSMVGLAIPDKATPSFQAALDVLARRKDVTLVVPCSSTFEVMSAVQAHVDSESTPERSNEKTGVVGAAIGTPVGDLSSSGTAVYQARALNDRRMIYCYPWPVVSVQQPNGTYVDTTMDGWASAAAVAGRIAALPDRAEPCTGKQVKGIKALGADLDEATMNILGSNGILVLAVDQGVLKVRDSITTNIDSATDKHVNINLTDDLLRLNLRSNFAQFKGNKLTSKLLDLVEDKTKDVLGKFQKFVLLNFYDPDSVVAEQDTAEPTKIIVRFRYAPIFPARIIEFRYSFDLRTSL